MNIYLIKQDTGRDDWDVYRGMIVAAHTIREAIELSYEHAKPSPKWGLNWPEDQKDLKISIIGVATLDESQVILTDYKSG